MQNSREPIRRNRGRSRGGNAPRRNNNRIANLMQILRRGVGSTWGTIKRDIKHHPKHADRSTRTIVRDRLETLVCLPGRKPQPHHVFLVNDKGILEKIADLAS